MLLSASLAATIFGNTDPIGKTIKIDGQMNARVTGVYEDIPYSTDFRDQSYIASMELYLAANPDIKTASHPGTPKTASSLTALPLIRRIWIKHHRK